MEDIGKTISTVKELIGCNDMEEVRKLKRKFEDLNPEKDMEKHGMLSLDQLIKQTMDLVNEVKGQSNYGKSLKRIDLDEKRGLILPVSKLAGETTAIENMKKIYELINGDVRKIGVYGMGGIGKTTVMKHINNRILEEKGGKFDCVIWVTVSKDSNLFKLQDDIACKLDVNLSKYKDTTTRAGILLKAFKKKKRYLLILDDLWEGYLLEDVGIPDPDNLEYVNGCKLALTTRSFDVCRIMKCEAIKMDLLSKQEAWSLFCCHVGLDVLQVKDLEPTMRAVALECARLPLAIATIAKSMRGETEAFMWRVALGELRAFSKEPGDEGQKVIAQLKFSYDRLKKEKLQKCMLFCALYPEDEEINRRELVELLALEGIIEKKEYKRDEIDEGNAMLNNLINQCLLEGGEKNSWVKMHDLVRDMALQINGLHSKYLTVSGIELSNVKWSEELLKIHLSNCYSLNVSPMCPRLTTFILNDNSLANIPNLLFQHFKALKVLNLSYCRSLQVLPNSISDLVNLVGLLLRDCRKLTHVPPLARLKNLQTLDFSVKYIDFDLDLLERKDFLIKDLEELSNLRYVNLILCSIKVFPRGIIARLSNLRYLVCNPLTKVSARELMCLKNLEMFKGAFHDAHDLCVYVKHIEQKRPRLSSYVFLVCSTDKFFHFDWYDPDEKVVKLENCNLGKIATENEGYLLPKDVQVLCIASDPDLASLCALAFLNYARDLRECRIIDCKGVRELVSTSSSSSFVLPSLERLRLDEMENLEALIGRKKKTCNVFPCLRQLEIGGSDRMKVVINIGLLSNLNNLEYLRVDECKEVEEIIGEWLDNEKDVNEGITQITLPNLKYLELFDLPHVRSICPASRPLICKSLELFNVFPCLRELRIIRCDRMKVVINIGLLSNLNNLEELDVQQSDALEEIIGEGLDDEKDVNEGITQITLPKLRTLWLYELPHLRCICPASRPLICKSLHNIWIEGCPEVEQCVYVGGDERGEASPSASLHPIQLKSYFI